MINNSTFGKGGKQIRFVLGLLLVSSTVVSQAAVLEYGDEDLMGTGTYSSDPKIGATLDGLAAGVLTDATSSFGHSFPFDPSAGDFAGTDQIYAGSNQTASHDGYSQYQKRIQGPQILNLDYSSLVTSGNTVTTITLGIAADDFQRPSIGQPFVAKINGVVEDTLTTHLNAIDETGPGTHFFTVGLSTSNLTADNHLLLSIDEGGDGGDGWAVDFLTVGVQTSPVPEPAPLFALGLSLAGFVALRKRN